jgi:hypothetical protein
MRREVGSPITYTGWSDELPRPIVSYTGSGDLKMERTNRLFTPKGNGFQIPRKRRPLDLSRSCSSQRPTYISLKPQGCTTKGLYMKQKEFSEFPLWGKVLSILIPYGPPFYVVYVRAVGCSNNLLRQSVGESKDLLGQH